MDNNFYKKLNSSIVEAGNELLINCDLYGAISNCLKIMGKATQADRVYFFKNICSQDPSIIGTTQKLEWNSLISKPQIENPDLQKIPKAEIAEFIKPLSKKHPYIGIVRNLEPSITKDLLEKRNVKSTIVLPIFAENEFWGFVGFDECKYERVWGEEEIAMLMSFAIYLSGAISRSNYEKKIEYLSHHDYLTGLYNRRFYDEALISLDNKENLPLTLIMADVNGLKIINDSFGHTMGDELLQKAAILIKEACREDDIVARLGGDEFIVILTKTDIFEAVEIIKRMKALTLTEKVGAFDISISFGYETKEIADENIREIFKKAEEDMYRHKLYESSSTRCKAIELVMNTLYEKSRGEMLHSKRVSELCEAIAIRLKFDKDEVNQVRIAGLLHDIGKMRIDEKILNKPGKLEPDEWDEMRKHPEIGFRILSSVNELSEMAKYIVEHHERWDGGGYPKGLRGEEILLQARIIGFADAYDSMKSDRSYQKALNEEEAVREIRRCSGTQFDPEIVKVFIAKVLLKD